MIEASSYGIPSVCTIDNHKYPVSTGYFHDREGYATSDILDGEKISDVYELIYRFAKMEPSSRNSLKNQARRASFKYDLSNVNTDFMALASVARPINVDEFRFSRFKDFCSIIYIRLIKKFV